MKLCIRNLTFDTTEAQLREYFEQIGPVSKVSIIYEKETNRPKGFGFVEMPSEADAQEAIDQLNGQELFGRPLKVEPARERPPRPGYENQSRPYRGNGNQR